MPEAVFFDLDGTLADTAPDLAGALNRLKAEQGLVPSPLAQLRPQVSNGVRGMLGVGFGITPDAPPYPALAERFLHLYATALCVETRLFAGMDELLSHLDDAGIAWGIVTNKARRFTQPTVEAFTDLQAAATVISGDSTPYTKPHPGPVLAALQSAGFSAESTLYVGDDERDIQAARAAGMPSIAALWGYRQDHESPVEWGADVLLDSPAELLDPANWPSSL